ncbi:NF-kappa-B essential modulator isoform X1 [Chanos chanos]|uniref:NF-kappa-B essential modulator n=1 Tax=Chanos chanos TaxID=29144 RepID=A0A6J2UWG4_CHACN|nr:NF-kappa-B essential modulator isoform X1 [Chanos chanos]
MVQPQPHGGSTLHWDMTGEEAIGGGSHGSLGASSQGSLRVPPELAGNEVVHRLLADNHRLREALKRSNDALKERCEEMEGWQRRSREEREFLSCRFREARALVERLAQENQSLQGQLNHNTSQTGNHSMNSASQTGSQSPDQELKCPAHEQNGLRYSPESVGETDKKDKAEAETSPRSLADCSVNSSDSSIMPSLGDSLPLSEVEDLEAGHEQGVGGACQPTEGSNEFLQLLKSHKEKLEERLRDLRRKNEDLEREKLESEKEKGGLRLTVEQLRTKLTQLTVGCGVTEESAQRSEVTGHSDSSHLAKLTEQLQAAQGRYKELQEKLDSLQKSSVQRDRTEALLKQKEKECVQLTKDTEALRAQVKSLLGELQERQTCLEKSEKEKQQLEEKLSSKTDSLQCLEREMEQVKKQHSVTVDKLLLQTQHLDTALKNERLVLVEERRKLAQLQHAYTCLFQDYDSKLKSENQAKQRGGDAEGLANRLVEAERALALKQEHIDKLKEEVEQLKGSLETVPVLTAQAEIYKMDFLAEREAREKLHQKKEELQEQLNQAKAEIDRLIQEGTSRARMEEMQQRHMEDYRNRLPQTSAPFQGAAMFNPAQPTSFRNNQSEELPDYRCPKCQYRAPDMDTLQIHVMDCIQ